MKRKSLTEAVSPEAQQFIEAGNPTPQFEVAQPEEERGEQEASFPLTASLAYPRDGEHPLPILIPQTFRLPQRLVDDLARAAIDRKLQRRKPWSQQDIAAEAIKEWLRKHASK